MQHFDALTKLYVFMTVTYLQISRYTYLVSPRDEEEEEVQDKLRLWF